MNIERKPRRIIRVNHATPDNIQHVALENRVKNELENKGIAYSTGHTYHESMKHEFAHTLSKNVNPLARMLRHLPDILVNSNHKTVGLDIKTNPDRNIALEVLPILESFRFLLDLHETDTFYVYSNGNSEPVVIPLLPKHFQKAMKIYTTGYHEELDYIVKGLSAKFLPEVPVHHLKSDKDPFILIPVSEMKNYQPWEEFIETL
jgi:hypothetical protein